MADGNTLPLFPSHTNDSMKLPAELFFPIFEHVPSRRELCMLASTSRIIQRPAEAALYKAITLPSRIDVERFCDVVRQVPRFAPLVKSLTIEWPITKGELDERYRADAYFRKTYWGGVQETLGKLVGLEELTIDDGRDHTLSWVLEGLGTKKLSTIRCGFVLDETFLGILKSQKTIKELSWTGSLVSFASGPRRVETPDETEEGPRSDDDVELPTIRAFQATLGDSSLPNLRILHTESLALARALVPGRRITHLWVPGANFATAYTSDYIYSHIPVPSLPDSFPPIRTSTTSAATTTNAALRVSGGLRDLSDHQIVDHLRRAIRDFARSKGPILSLRLSLGLTDRALREVIDCISQELPTIKALGFLPAGAISNLTFPLLPNLHTLTLWSLPSARALDAITNNPSLPSLRTVACLHFSPSFEWICLPINDVILIYKSDKTLESIRQVQDTGGIPWDRTVQGNQGQRRPTAVHDPINLLWREV